MATFTSFLGLRKPATSDNVNVALDINDNMDDIDAAVNSAVAVVQEKKEL